MSVPVSCIQCAIKIVCSFVFSKAVHFYNIKYLCNVYSGISKQNSNSRWVSCIHFHINALERAKYIIRIMLDCIFF